MRIVAWSVWPVLLITANVSAESLSEQWLNALTKESESSLQLRSHYLARDRATAADSEAWAAGGWLSYRSGWVNEQWQIGLTAYTSQAVYAPADKDGTALLMTGQQAYTIVGESFFSYRYQPEQKWMAGRFVMNQFEINPQDTRMTPRSFEGLLWQHQDARTEFSLALIDRMKARHWDYFEQVSTVAGAPNGVQNPLWVASARHKLTPRLNIGLSYYQLPDLMQSTYSDLVWRLPLIGMENELRLSAQYMKQSSIGRQLLATQGFDTWSAGVKAEWVNGPLTLGVARLQTDTGAAYRVPFGSWMGYASRIITNFNRAGEQVWAVDALLRFDRLGVPGLSVHSSVTWGDGALLATNQTPLDHQREIDVTIEYRFKQGDWPNWLKPYVFVCVRDT